ncbi:MAG TPA: 50S ribosomal protein L4 [Gammaproteobacteria bacterium]|nr:50S ribosomal protein L4 [Gammaproteobacteria bacterium]
MDLKLHQSGNKKAGKLSVSDAVFAAPYNEALIHQVLNAYTTRARAGTRSHKTRAEVRGGGKKPWRQKGTGRARAGTNRSPIWRGGGITFAAKPKDYRVKVNRKMYRGAIRSILSELARQERLSCIDEFTVDEPKTKKAKEVLAGMGLEETLIITDALTENAFLATRNLPRVDIIDMAEIDPYTLIGFNNVLITKAAVEKMEAWLA